MRTTVEIMKEVWGESHPEIVSKVAIQYAKELIDEILTRGDGDLIYIDDNEAVYSYSQFQEIKKNLF